MGGGAFWGGGKNFNFSEEKHKTGYCLELFISKKFDTPIKRDEMGVFVYKCVEAGDIVERLTVPQVEELAKSLKLWAETMREGNHYKEDEA